MLWQKLLVNAVINPLTCLLEMKNGELLHYDDYEPIAQGVVREGVAVAKALGVSLDFEDCLRRVRLVAEQTAGRRGRAR